MRIPSLSQMIIFPFQPHPGTGRGAWQILLLSLLNCELKKYSIDIYVYFCCLLFRKWIESKSKWILTIFATVAASYLFEPRHDKTNKVSVRPAKTQISPGIRPVGSEFAVCMKKPWALKYLLSAQRRLIRLGGCPGWSEPSLGAQSLWWFCHVAAHFLSDYRLQKSEHYNSKFLQIIF